MSIYNEQCVKHYNKFIESGNKIDLNICLKYFDEILFKPDYMSYKKEATSLGNCIILNQKKVDKYIHTYNILPIIAKIESLETTLPDNYLKKFMDIFDTTPVTNCCNCISIVLYSNMNAEKLSVYLPNILITLKNIEKY